MNILKNVCHITTSFTAIHFFYDSVIISRQHLKQSTCQGNCLNFTILFATIHYNKRSAVDSRQIHPFFEVYCAVFIGCTNAVTRCTHCYLLSLVVTRCITRCHSLSFVAPLVVTRCHSLSLVVPLVVTCCHSLSLDVPLVCLFINDLQRT